jgi:ABC-type phosphate transport system auxiliary subunit
MKICADWKLYLDMIALGGIQPLYVDIDVVNFDMSGISNTNNELRLTERRMYLEQVLPASVLKDYDAYARSIRQYERLKKHHLWGFVTFIERVLFKLEKWRVLR